MTASLSAPAARRSASALCNRCVVCDPREDPAESRKERCPIHLSARVELGKECVPSASRSHFRQSDRRVKAGCGLRGPQCVDERIIRESTGFAGGRRREGGVGTTEGAQCIDCGEAGEVDREYARDRPTNVAARAAPVLPRRAAMRARSGVDSRVSRSAAARGSTARPSGRSGSRSAKAVRAAWSLTRALESVTNSRTTGTSASEPAPASACNAAAVAAGRLGALRPRASSLPPAHEGRQAPKQLRWLPAVKASPSTGHGGRKGAAAPAVTSA